jgi:hypothetical protein
MNSDVRVVLACLTFAVMFAFSSARRLQAQDNSAPSTMASIDPYLMDRDSEIAMARSAGPVSVSSGAKVLVLGRRGYETAVEGKNGFVCVVGRFNVNQEECLCQNPLNLVQRERTGQLHRILRHSY